MAASESEIDDAIRKRAHTFREEAETITMRIVRRLLEEDLGLAEGSLEPQKKYISKAVDRVLNESTRTNGTRRDGGDAKPQGIAEVAKEKKEVVQREEPKAEEAPLGGQKEDQDGAKSEEDDGSMEEPAAVEDSEDEEEEGTRSRSKSGKGKRGLKRRGGRKQKLESDEEEAEESEEAAGSAEESEQEEEVVVRKRSKQKDKPGKSKGRRRGEPQSDLEDSEAASSSSEEGESPARKRRKKENSSSEEDVGSDEEPSHKQKLRKDRVKKGKDKVRSQPAQAAYLTSDRVVELKAILKQCGMTVGPSLYKKAKDSKDPEAVLVRGLKDLLEKEGLSGNPSDKEIKRVKKRLQTQKELEGIDTENIIEESGRGTRRAAREAAAKVPQYIEGSDSDEDGSGQASDEEEEDDEAFSEGNDDEEGDED